MISDTLSDAVYQIDEYLQLEDVYKGDIKDEIIKLRNEMERIRIILDTPPPIKWRNLKWITQPSNKSNKPERNLA